MTMATATIASITQTIQLAIAPVFLLSAVGTIIGVLTTFLTRTVDRIRVLEESPEKAAPEVHAAARAEIGVLKHRLRLVFVALLLDALCALFVGLLIVIAFVDAFFGVNLASVVAILFVAAMLAFIASLGILLRGIAVSITRVTGFITRVPSGERA